jgi:hypothetical protein
MPSSGRPSRPSRRWSRRTWTWMPTTTGWWTA